MSEEWKHSRIAVSFLTVFVSLGLCFGAGIALAGAMTIPIADTGGSSQDATLAESVDIGELIETPESVDGDRTHSTAETLHATASHHSPGTWPGEPGGPSNWTPVTGPDGFALLNELEATNQPWTRMTSGSGTVGQAGTQPTLQLASDGDNLFWRMRTLGSPYNFVKGKWQNQGFHQMAIATQAGGQWQTQAYVGIHINNNGRIFIQPAGAGSQTTVYAGNQDIEQAQGVRVTQASPDPGPVTTQDNGYWTDVQVPLDLLAAEAGIMSDEPVKVFFGTATQPNTINRDRLGNAGSIDYNLVTEVTIEDLVADQAQTVQITEPAAGETVTTTTPTIRGTSTAAGTLTLFVNGEQVTEIQNVSENWEYTLTEAQALADGEHTVQAQVELGDDSAITAVRPFTVDTADPIQIETAELAEWTRNQPGYQQQLTATGGVEPYNWSIDAGSLPDGLELNTTTGEITGTPTQAGTFNVTVRVTGANDRTATRQYTSTINQPPSITTPGLLPSGAVDEQYSKTLVATGGTGERTWEIDGGTALPQGLTFDNITGEISGIPVENGIVTFEATVTDETGASDNREFTLSIRDLLAVETTTLSDWTVDLPEYHQTITAVGGQGPYEFEQTGGTLPPGITLTSDGTLSGTPDVSGTYSFEVTVTDAENRTATRTLSIAINEGPTITGPVSLTDGVVDVSYSQELLATNGTEPLHWSVSAGELPDGLTIDSTTGIISGNPTQVETGAFTVQVEDRSGATDTRQYTIEVGPSLTIDTQSLPAWTVDRPDYTAAINVSGGTTPYEWNIIGGGLPAGLNFDHQTGEITGMPSTTGTFPLEVTVTDRDGTQRTASYTIFIDDPITITSPSTLRGGVGGISYFETLTFDGGTAPVTWNKMVGDLPSGLSLAQNGEITGTPAENGTFTFIAAVTDTTGSTAQKEFSITVGESLGIATISLQDWTVGQPYGQNIEVAGGTPSYEWELDSGTLPPGLELNSTTGRLGGTPTDPGTYNFTIAVTDQDGTVGTQPYTLTISTGPTISTEELGDGVVGVGYSHTLGAINGTSPLTWSLGPGEELPPGLSLEPQLGTISGVPAEAGNYTFTVRVTDTAGAVHTRYVTMNVTPALDIVTSNLQAWTANQSGYLATLEASGGTPDYAWSEVSGLPDGLSLSSSGQITGTLNQPGVFDVTVGVTDADQNTVQRSFDLVINEPLALTASSTLSGGGQGVTYSEQLTATGGTGNLTWAITDEVLPPGLSLNPDTGEIQGTPNEPGSYTFEVTVTDQTGATATQQYTITIGDGLSITTTTVPYWTLNQTGYTATIAVAGGTQPYEWNVTNGTLPTGLSLNNQTGQITGAPIEAGTFNFTVEVTDHDESVDAREYTMQVNPRPSVVTTPPDGVVGVAYSADLEIDGGTGPGTWIATDDLPPGLVLDVNGRLSGTPTAAGTFTFTVQATDETGATATRSLTITIGDGLVVETTTLPPWTVNQPGYNQVLEASGGAGPYTWDIAVGSLPDGLEFSSVGRIIGTPTQVGTFDITVQVIDTYNTTVSRTLRFDINPGLTLTAPTTLKGGLVGVEYSDQLSLTGGTGPYQWSVTDGQLPPGLSLDSATGAITGTPTDAGSFSFDVTVIDTTGAIQTETYTIAVQDTDLSVRTTTLPDWTVDQPGYTTWLRAIGGEGPYTWSIASGQLPEGLVLNQQSGIISGTPTVAGNSQFTVRATDVNGQTATRSLSIHINDPLQITTPEQLPGGIVSDSYSELIETSGGTAPIAWRVVDGSLPPGLSLSRSVGTVSGTPTATGTYEFRIRATDAAGALATKWFTLTVTDELAITTESLADGTVDQPYADQLNAAGGTQPYSWSIADGQLPDGLTLDAQTGSITGTPTANGTFTFTVQVTDDEGDTATRDLSITIGDADPVEDPLEIVTTELADGTVDVDYTDELAATGGIEPYAWSIADGQLPDGLTLEESTGAITGTPTAAGTFSFTVQVTDEDGETATRELSIEVVDAVIVDPGELGVIEVVDARLETEEVNSIRATSTITLRNNRSTAHQVTLEIRINRETVTSMVEIIGPGDTHTFEDERVLDDPGNYRFSFVIDTEEDIDGVLQRVRTPDQDYGEVDVPAVTDGPDEDEATCELFGIDIGGFGVCWYWWVLLSGFAATLASYGVQTRLKDVRPLLATPAAERGARYTHAVPRLVGFTLGACLVAFVALFGLWEAGARNAVQILPVFLLAIAAGAGFGTRYIPSLDPPAAIPDGEEPPAAAADSDKAAGSSQATFELFTDASDEWRWRLRHHNGNVIAAAGRGFDSQGDVEDVIEHLRRADEAAMINVAVGDDSDGRDYLRFELYIDDAGEWRWRYREDGSVIATTGEGYTNKAGAENGIQSVQRNAPDGSVASLDDETVEEGGMSAP